MYTDEDIKQIRFFIKLSLWIAILFGTILICELTTKEWVKDVRSSQEFALEIVTETRADILECEPTIEDLGTFEVTAYCACMECCGKTDGITASGTVASEGRTVAADPSVLPYGTEIYIKESDGLLHPYIVEDCGGAIKGNRIDVYFESHEDAKQFGRQNLEVFIRY